MLCAKCADCVLVCRDQLSDADHQDENEEVWLAQSFYLFFCANHHLTVGWVSSVDYNPNSENVVSNHTEQALFSQQCFKTSSVFLKAEVKRCMSHQNV